MSFVKIELSWTILAIVSVYFTSGIEERPASWSVVTERSNTSSLSDGLVLGGSSTATPRISSSTGSQNVSSEAKKVCRGTSSGLGHMDDQNERYQLYKTLYTNCTHVDGNLEIVFLSNYSLDLGFLRSIREIGGYVLIVANYLSYIPLTNLRIIRGRNLFEYENKYFSLYIALNYDKLQPNVGLKELRFTSLHEIMAGSVFIYDNPQLCFHETINWKDILSGSGARTYFNRSSELEKLNIQVTCVGCHESCKSHCWGHGPEYCQELTRVSCSLQCDGHCFGPSPSQCCNPECAGGCTGPSTAQCWSCKNFDNGGVCANVCPPLEIYNPHEYRMVPNHEFKYAYGSLCVDKCPAHLIADKVSCVQDCGTGKMAGKDGKCQECNGPCPKMCQIRIEDSDFINSKNIKEFAGCTIIQGSIKILDASFAEDKYFGTVAMKPNQLSVLESVQEVTDFVQVQANHPNFRNLGFLKNLRIIHGRKLDRARTSLQIFKTSLESLALDSLEEVRFGHIYISNNSRLCYASSVKWEKLREKPEQKTIIEFNRDATSCAQDSEICASECTDDGCWGPFDSQCVSCKNFHLGRHCLKDCASNPGIFMSGDKECQKCDVHCLADCSGPGPEKCDGCRNATDGPYCVDRCPVTKYMDENNICQPCHPNCDSGCTGPKNTVGPTGCNSCPLVVYGNDRRNVTECLKINSQCPDGFYQQKIINDTNFKSLEGKQGCMKCHAQCTTCNGYGATFCISCRHYQQEDGECVLKCQDGFFSAPGSNRCLRCDQKCLGCHGPTSADCSKCKLYKTYSDFKVGEANPNFNCTETCPDFAPYKQLDATLTEMICVAEDNDSVHRQRMIISITVVVVGISAIILIISLILCKQRSKARMSAQKLTDRMQQPYEAEPLKQTDAKPDMAKMLIVSESELRWGNYILGSGAFGTVFKGVWIPAGKPQVSVAIKVLQKSSSGQSKEFLDEARIMSSVDHPCCVHILGICLSAQMMLITRLMPLGCLLEFIRKNKDEVGSAILLNWCRQIAEGMNHLESHGIVHCDLAARNVLVESDDQVKITDFGLAKMLEFGHKEFQAEGGKMPIKWLAIESITTRIFTHKSDVWSFGVTLWELFTFGKRPYENMPVREIPIMLEKGERLLQPNICSIDLYMLMAKCWMVDSEKRPKFETLVRELSDMAKNPQRYLHIPREEYTLSSRPVSQSSDYDSRFEHYIEPTRKGSNMSIRYTRQPTANGGENGYLWKDSFDEDPAMYDKSRPLSSRVSDPVKALDNVEEYEMMSPTPIHADDCAHSADALALYINVVDDSSNSAGNSEADNCSLGRTAPGFMSMHKNHVATNPEYFDSFHHDTSAKTSVLRHPARRDGRTVPRSRVDSLGFTEESSRSSSAEGSEHEYYNFYHAPPTGLQLRQDV